MFWADFFRSIRTNFYDFFTIFCVVAYDLEIMSPMRRFQHLMTCIEHFTRKTNDRINEFSFVALLVLVPFRLSYDGECLCVCFLWHRGFLLLLSVCTLHSWSVNFWKIYDFLAAFKVARYAILFIQACMCDWVGSEKKQSIHRAKKTRRKKNLTFLVVVAFFYHTLAVWNFLQTSFCVSFDLCRFLKII